jgi:hypothetical protein
LASEGDIASLKVCVPPFFGLVSVDIVTPSFCSGACLVRVFFIWSKAEKNAMMSIPLWCGSQSGDWLLFAWGFQLSGQSPLVGVVKRVAGFRLVTLFFAQ